MPQTAFKSVTFTDPETGEIHRYVPGDEVPDKVVKLISEQARPYIFEDGQDEEVFTEDGEMKVVRDNSDVNLVSGERSSFRQQPQKKGRTKQDDASQ